MKRILKGFFIDLGAIYYFTMCTLEKFQCARATLCALVMVDRIWLNDSETTERDGKQLLNLDRLWWLDYERNLAPQNSYDN